MKKNLLRGMVLCLVMLLLAVSALAAEPAPTVKSVFHNQQYAEALSASVRYADG